MKISPEIWAALLILAALVAFLALLYLSFAE
jgi:hypothetical protein